MSVTGLDIGSRPDRKPHLLGVSAAHQEECTAPRARRRHWTTLRGRFPLHNANVQPAFRERGWRQVGGITDLLTVESGRGQKVKEKVGSRLISQGNPAGPH